MIKKVLIANRGEIACRVMKTCRHLGIETVAVYSTADRDALHVEMADEAVLLGEAAAQESYLCVDKVLEAAKETGADAVHPGYGFLSENDRFAEACEKAGIIFIGPPASSIRAMGGKSEAKALMEKAGVPLVPGYHGDNQDESFLQKEAEKIGYPVLIKASAGGGGKGMRVVESAKDFAAALSAAKREAKASFGNDHVLIEKYLVKPRHVEIQVFADKQGNAVYLFERDCSIQRRHQKVVEEAPAPGLSEDTRKKMGEAAVNAAKAIDYVGAGTVEFLLDKDGSFYFMEMNTRLQVEHPVTEMITGLDLVALQIAVANGEKLPFKQDDLKINGHAIEVRLYAEDPDNNFLPGAGKIDYLRFPMETEETRIDTGVREAPYGDGDVISIHYDPMIAKIIVHGADRAEAIEGLQRALTETRIAGLKTNLSFLRRIAALPAFAKADLDTKFIDRYEQDLFAQTTLPDEVPILAVMGIMAADEEKTADAQMSSSDPFSPWHELSGWRIGGAQKKTFGFTQREDRTHTVQVQRLDDVIEFDVNGTVYKGQYWYSGYDLSLDVQLNGQVLNATVLRNGNKMTVLYDGMQAELDYHDPLYAEDGESDAKGGLHAPMPGKVVAVHATVGANVKKGEPLIIVEAMKMEHTIIAPADGVIDAVNAAVGEQVDEKRALVAFKA